MSLQVRPGYVNPLTIMKENKNNPTKRQMGNVQDDNADKLTDLRTKQQSLQNEMILLKSTGSDSAGNTSEKLETLEKKLEEVSNDINAAKNNIKMKESPAVNISISLEGQQNYRDSLGVKIQSESYESLLNQNKLMIQNRPKLLKCNLSYIAEMCGKMQTMASGKTTEEKASVLLKIYSSMYDEIMQEKNDDNEEIILEQINELNKVLKNEADFLEYMSQSAPVYIAFYERLADDWESMGNYEKASKARSGLLRLKNDIVPENLYEKIMTASKLFVEQYTMQKNGSIENILEKIFPTSQNKDSM